MASTNKTVLVTGGAGYIGSHACKLLAENGYNPVVVDNLSTGHDWAVKWGPLEECDLRDGEKLGAIFARHKPAAVMHFAALSDIGQSVREPALYHDNNVNGTAALLAAMQHEQVQTLIFSSTCSTYGDPVAVPISETHPLNPINPYGKSKRAAEELIAAAAAEFGLRYVGLRYFNAAGADPEAEIGEAHDPESHLIPLVLDVAAGRRDHIAVFGTDYATPDGTCVRDYIHIGDLAQAHLLAFDYLTAGGEPVFLNLGNDRGFSVREVIQTVEEITGRTIAVEEAARRAGDSPELISDSTLARKLLSWQPRRPGVATQIEDAWRWHQKYHNPA